ncbi:hypothetical protein [Microbacterium sp. P05]|uniref:hypothetical protein n=1 Tax=Microbacterium sp. P05 TaxID=3366948 RepID=UPI003744CC6D
MRSWVVRFASLYVFDVVVLLLIGAVLPTVRVGFAALWAGAVLAAATIWVKPLIQRGFRSLAARSTANRTAITEKLVQYGLVLAVEAVVWVLVVLFTGVSVRGFFWGWVLPPVLLLLAWAVYDLVDDRLEARAGRLYDRATTRREAGATDAAPGVVPPVPTAPRDVSMPGRPTASAPRDPYAGLTPEQRRMLDNL